MLVSPAEPHEFYKVGTVSSTPEKYGADFLILGHGGLRVGIQRKEISDLIASIYDGRVERELYQLKKLDVGIWIIEGELRWTSDGQLLSQGRRTYTRGMHLGVLSSLSWNGYWTLSSTSTTDTIAVLSSLNQWFLKPHHGSLSARPSAKRNSNLGAVDKQDEMIHIMQGFPGVGYEKAKLIVESYKGLPFSLITDPPLINLRGIGPKIVKQIEGYFSENS